jgi:hypothetical protein
LKSIGLKSTNKIDREESPVGTFGTPRLGMFFGSMIKAASTITTNLELLKFPSGVGSKQFSIGAIAETDTR